MEGELKLLLRQFKHKATSTYSYLIASKLNNAILIDPVKEEIKKYQKKLKEFNLDLKYAIDTHVHADHITALGDLRDIYDCKTIMGEQSKVNCISVLNSITCPKSFPSPLEYSPGVKLGVNVTDPDFFGI